MASGEWKLEQPWWERPQDPAIRERPAQRPALSPAPRTRQIIAVGGGKGGSGKSLLSVSLAVELARRGLHPLLVDCDLGAGSHTNIVDFFLLADTGILVAVPEPTSVENAYLFLKAAFLRRLRALDLDDRGRQTLQEAMRGISGRPRSPAEIVLAVAERDLELATQIDRALATFRPWLVVNQVRLPADLDLGDGMCAVAQRVFGITLSYLGHLRYYDQVWRAVRAHQPVFFEELGRLFAADLAAVVNRLPGAPELAREVSP